MAIRFFQMRQRMVSFLAGTKELMMSKMVVKALR